MAPPSSGASDSDSRSKDSTPGPETRDGGAAASGAGDGGEGGGEAAQAESPVWRPVVDFWGDAEEGDDDTPPVMDRKGARKVDEVDVGPAEVEKEKAAEEKRREEKEERRESEKEEEKEERKRRKKKIEKEKSKVERDEQKKFSSDLPKTEKRPVGKGKVDGKQPRGKENGYDVKSKIENTKDSQEKMRDSNITLKVTDVDGDEGKSEDQDQSDTRVPEYPPPPPPPEKADSPDQIRPKKVLQGAPAGFMGELMTQLKKSRTEGDVLMGRKKVRKHHKVEVDDAGKLKMKKLKRRLPKLRCEHSFCDKVRTSLFFSVIMLILNTCK